MSRRTKKGDDLARFGNALRNYLGLEPIYQVGQAGKRPKGQPSELERFYPGVHHLPSVACRHRKHAA